LGRSIDYYGKGRNAIALYDRKITFIPEESISVEPGLETYDGAGDFVGIRPQERETCLANSVLNCLRTYKYFYPDSVAGQVLNEENETQVFADLKQRLYEYKKDTISKIFHEIKIKLMGFWGKYQYFELVRFAKENKIKYHVSAKKQDLIDHLNAGKVAVFGFSTIIGSSSFSRHGGGNIAYTDSNGILEGVNLPFSNILPNFISGDDLENTQIFTGFHAVLAVKNVYDSRGAFPNQYVLILDTGQHAEGQPDFGAAIL
jgi:hypothetical protein